MDIKKIENELDLRIANLVKIKEDKNFLNNFVNIANICIEAIKNGKTIFFAGNGGSSADAQHASAELVVRFKKNRKALSSIALGTNTAISTATSNDFGYDSVFSREFEALGKKGDIVIGISTSGNSSSIVNLFKKAKEFSAITVGLTGKNGGQIKQYCDYIILCPSEIVEQIQEMHAFILHMLCKIVEEKFLD